MEEHPNAERLRRLAAAFIDRDAETLAAIFAEGVVWRVGGRSPVAGEYRGLREIFEFARLVGELSGGTYRVELQWVLADDERGVSLYRARGTRGERAIDLDQVGLVRFSGDRVAEVTIVPADQHEFDAFWS